MEKRFARKMALTALCLLLFYFLVTGFWPRGSEVLQKVIFSGNTAVTVAALEDFAEDIGDGEKLSDAFADFCRKVIQESNLDLD